MPRKATTLGPSRLSRILVDLRRVPRLELSASLESLKLTLAARNDHFGARCALSSFSYCEGSPFYFVSTCVFCRHFVKEELPRIRYANPTLNIEVFKVPKSKTDIWQPEMSVKFGGLSSILPESNNFQCLHQPIPLQPFLSPRNGPRR
jgi:small subunit ribosomal protein S25